MFSSFLKLFFWFTQGYFPNQFYCCNHRGLIPNSYSIHFLPVSNSKEEKHSRTWNLALILGKFQYLLPFTHVVCCFCEDGAAEGAPKHPSRTGWMNLLLLVWCSTV